MDTLVLGIDIGGSHITAALVSLESKTLIRDSQVRAFVNSKGTAEEIIEVWTDVIQNVYEAFPVADKKLGIAMPGPFDYKEGISLMLHQDKYDALYGMNIKGILSQRLHIDQSAVLFMNDAECFLKGEVFNGAARGVQRAVGLTIGTGLGSSRFRNGTVEDANLWCTPFLEGIAEDYLSSRWFVKRFAALTSIQVNNVKEIVEQDVPGPVLETIFGEFGRNLALFLNESLSAEQPEAIILGGNIANAFHLFEYELRKHLSGSLLQSSLQQTHLGEDACLIGAASAWKKTEPKNITA
jgi:glucokinase